MIALSGTYTEYSSQWPVYPAVAEYQINSWVFIGG